MIDAARSLKASTRFRLEADAIVSRIARGSRV
jgi:hypothetical protein